MVVTLTLAVDPTAVHYGELVTFSGSILEDGVPLETQNVQIFVAGTRVLDLYADSFGNYYGQWTPDASWTGVYQAQAYAPIYAGVWSSSVTLTVAGGVQVRFFLFDEDLGAPVEGAVVTLDGVQQYTDSSGLAVYEGAAQGTHSFSVSAPGYSLVTAFDVFGDEYGLTGMFTIVWKPTGDPYPEDQPWTMEFHLASGVVPPPPPQIPWAVVGAVGIAAVMIYLSEKKGTRFWPSAP